MQTELVIQKKGFLGKFIGNKAFYKMVFAVAIPIMIQNGITNFVSLLDNIMVGLVGEEQMNGVAIVNQLFFIFNLGIFGAVSGAGIFTAQYFGKGDNDGVVQTFRFKLMTAVVISAVAAGIFALFYQPLIKLFISMDLSLGENAAKADATFNFGVSYMWVMLVGLLPFALSQAYSGTLRETGHTVLPMVAGFAAVAVNCVGNYLLIFGKFGCPELGVVGAAIASVASRFVELGMLIVATHSSKKIDCGKGVFARFFHVDKELVRKIFLKGAPLFVNEVVWATGMTLLTLCYSMRGLSAVAAYSISSTVVNVFNIAYMALGNSVGIIVGKYLGAGDVETAQDVDNKMIAFSVMTGLVLGALLAATSWLFPMAYNVSDEAKRIAASFLLITGCLMPLHGFLHSCYFTLRCGGKTLITFLYDSVFVCVVNVPLAFALVKLTNLDVTWVYLIANGIEVFKAVLGFVMLRKKIWINKIV